MPIKEILVFAISVGLAIAIGAGPSGVRRIIEKMKVEILMAATRTDNWGNPSIFKQRRPPSR